MCTTTCLSSNALVYRPTGETAHILQRHDEIMQRWLLHSRQDDLFEVQPTTKSPPPTTKALEQASISSKQVFGRSPIQHELRNCLSGIIKKSSSAERFVLYWNFFSCSLTYRCWRRQADDYGRSHSSRAVLRRWDCRLSSSDGNQAPAEAPASTILRAKGHEPTVGGTIVSINGTTASMYEQMSCI